jgi:glycine/D-amino acid oxidase-like deaminating enzyme
VLRAADEYQLEVEPLTAATIERRWSGLRVGENLVGVYEPTAGYLRVEDCVEAQLAAAEAGGARILIKKVTDFQVASWITDEETITIFTDDGYTVQTERLVVTAGAWASQLLAALLPPLSVRRKSLFWFKINRETCGVSNDMPVFLFELPEGIFYGFPSLDGHTMKVAEHSGGQVLTSPGIVDRTIDEKELKRLVHFLATHLPGVSCEVVRHATCLYTMSPDENFIVDRHPQHPNIVFAAGLSGHGFKFTPVLGKALADLAVDGETDLPIEFLSISRFAQ